jgi:predicted aspartyl protease
VSGFLDLTPTLRIQIDNPFLSRDYPLQGTVVAVIDTGYDGFLTIPISVYEELELHRLEETKRVLTLADGTILVKRSVRKCKSPTS